MSPQPERPSTALKPIQKQSWEAGAWGDSPIPPQALRKSGLTASHGQMLPAGREIGNILPGLGKESTAPAPVILGKVPAHAASGGSGGLASIPSSSALAVNQISVSYKAISKLTKLELCQLQHRLPVCSPPALIPHNLSSLWQPSLPKPRDVRLQHLPVRKF